MQIPESVRQFIRRHDIDEGEIIRVADRIAEHLPGSTLEFDTDTYAPFGVLRLTLKPDTLEPLLFGSISNLTSLSQALWNENADDWHEDLSDLSQRGTFLKRAVLIPAVLDTIERYHAGGPLLDLGCGDGILFRELVQRYANVWAADFAPRFIEQLRSEFPTHKQELLVQDATNLTVDQVFDTIVACALFLGIPDIERALASITSKVGDGGHLIVADVHSAYHRSLGYFRAGELVYIHDRTQTFRIEKMVGGGRTKAIHNHHPPELYRRQLERLGMSCIYDKDLCVTNSHLENVSIPSESRDGLRKALARDMEYPPFRILVFRKDGLEPH